MAKKSDTEPFCPGRNHGQTLQALLELTSDVVLLLDARRRIRASSRRAQVVLGLAPEDGSFPVLLLHLAGEAEIQVLDGLLRDSGLEQSRHAKIGFRQAGGGILELDVHLKPLPNEGRMKGWALLVGKRLAPQTPGDDMVRYARLIDRIIQGYPEPVLIVDPPSRTIIECNRAATSALGYSRQELVDRSLDSLAENGVFSEESERLRRYVYSTTGIFHSRTRLRRQDKALLNFSYTSVALFDEEGRIVAFLCILHDRTEAEAREAQLLALAEDANLLSRRLGALTGALRKAEKEPRRLSEWGLSQRQIEVARLVAAGNPTKTIAKSLGLAEATIKGHLGQIYRSLEVTNRIDFLRIVHEKGLRME